MNSLRREATGGGGGDARRVLLREREAIRHHDFAVMFDVGSVLYLVRFVPSLYTVQSVEVKPRSLIETSFSASVEESCEMSCFCV